MVISNAIAHSRPAERPFGSGHKGKLWFDLISLLLDPRLPAKKNLFEVSVKYAWGFTTLKIFPSPIRSELLTSNAAILVSASR